MLKVDNIEVWGFTHAIRGMRNPMNSWDKSDSSVQTEDCLCCQYADNDDECSSHHILNGSTCFHLGENDLDLMRRLFKAGTEHRKYMRQIFVSMDITAPLYWWKEADKYQIGTTTNSCSTMHKIHTKEFTIDDFSHEHLNCYSKSVLETAISGLNAGRKHFLETKRKDFWRQMIQLLPSSYNQKRTLTLNYEVAYSMIKQRKNHKLDEWHDMVDVLMDLPYMRTIIEE